VTEAEWLACADPVAMLRYLQRRASDRKLRLFGCACCRSVWHILPNGHAREIVVAAEQFADGLVTDDELMWAQEAFMWEGGPEIGSPHDPYLAALASEAVTQLGRESDAVFAARTGRVVPDWPEQAWEAASCSSNQVAHTTPLAERHQQLSQQANFLRDIFGNPFRPVAFDPAWRTDAVVGLARGAYEDRAFDRLPALADALERAGCADAAVLAHCRGPGPHVRGCWVVDLVLGKN
jgi:hypothetical protein